MKDATLVAQELQPLIDHLDTLLPVCSPRFQLEAFSGAFNDASYDRVGLYKDRRGNLCLVLVLLSLDAENEPGVPCIWNYKQQECVLVSADHIDHPHLKAYLDGWALALQHVFAHGELKYVRKLNPQQLSCPDVLRLQAPRTAEEFAYALLGSWWRLGHALPAVTSGPSWPPFVR